MATTTTAGSRDSPLPPISKDEALSRLGMTEGSSASSAPSSSPSASGYKMAPGALTPAFGLGDYARFFASGALCATLTHGAMTPIDVVKTRIQLEPKGTKETMLSMGRKIIASEGPTGLLTGFGPTAVGYLIQGGAKFAGYEYFKKKGVDLAGSQEAASQNRQVIYLGGASAAEVIATTLLTPLEAARIRLVSERGYAKGLVSAITRMGSEEGIAGFYAGYAPILCKQVPYAIGQFVTNEWAHTVVDANISKEERAKYGKAGEVTIQLGCGMVAGVAAAVLSHPADTLLSKINKGGGGKGSAMTKLIRLARETGPIGIWAGLGTRMLMTAFLVSGQFCLFEQIGDLIGKPQGISIPSDSEKGQ
ncbi:related to MIR1 - Phosphate transporter of the mitochondrial carrier (MCF) family [Melanopsichium pennsylvanicum]|uniref:Related to MIR1 - Phosphate transporter of the mitochondrial carrier (MCF) family n=2 Tax=Melanopsichium pennsylvanicum TaxID=63383 RepID=A0AAJ5C2P5_9BASI|nr:related to MIR1-Phosphate transporter of the mitochondrial carrier (MCF) family [Melanopsichium pennsylvanicum 4]SNX81780.1 related to MIR1 - Phosphate transporter of the mitochondrial carrier (MCF) family [Melanopsichium pennsylvanicum]